MLSKLAEIDIRGLQQNGYEPTLEEIIRLNDLAIRIERGKETTPQSSPRFAFAGNVILYELTVGAEMWWTEIGKDSFYSDTGRLNGYFFLHAFSRDVEGLNRLKDQKEIRKTVKRWMRQVEATESELWRALLWVKFGDEQYRDMEEEIRIQTSLDDEKTMETLWLNLIACSGSMGIDPKSLVTCTHSQLMGMLVQSNLRAGIPMKQSIAKDYIAYQQTLKKIESRGKKVENHEQQS